MSVTDLAGGGHGTAAGAPPANTDPITGEVLTGAEVITSTALARPTIAEPGSPITPALVAYQCRSVEVWAEHCDSIPEIRDTANKLDAIGRYIEVTGTDGAAAVQATLRRLEARIGELSPRQQGKRTDQLPNRDQEVLNDRQKADFRKMADHPEIVQAVIDDSTDESPASRRKVMDEINKAKHAPAVEPTDAEVRAAEHAALVASKARKLAAFVDTFPTFIGLGSHPDRAEILAAMPEKKRLALLSIEEGLT